MLIVTSDVKPRNQVLSSDYLERPTLPVLRITQATANAILARAGLDATGIQEEIAALGEKGHDWAAYEAEEQVRVRVQLRPPETLVAYNVLGLLPGADASLADELVIVSCHYDGLGRGPDGTLFPGANGNASGVAVMLEIARLWQEQQFQPRRSVLFVSWAGGELSYSGAHYLRDERGFFLRNYDIAAVVHLDRLGGSTGDGIVVRQTGGRDNLFNLLVASSDSLDVDVTTGLAQRHHYQWVFSGQYGDRFAGRNGTLVITWGDPQPALAEDRLENISPQHLSQAAQVINLTLITAAHEPRY